MSASLPLALSLALAIVHVAGPTLAGSVQFEIIANDVAVLNAWPGTDGLIGTADDVVSGNPSPLNGSEPNFGTYGYNAFDFVGDGSVTETGLLPDGMNAVTFVQGTIDIDTAVASSGGGSLVTGWSVSGSQPFPGHGAYTAEILAVNGGSFDPGTHAFSLDVDMRATLAGGTADALGFVLTGTAFVVEAADYGTPTGNAYVDDVVIPLAETAGALGVVFLHATGTIPESSGGSGGFFPEMPFEAALVALNDPETPVVPETWGRVKERFRGE
jgi:hypothetical protein